MSPHGLLERPELEANAESPSLVEPERGVWEPLEEKGAVGGSPKAGGGNAALARSIPGGPSSSRATISAPALGNAAAARIAGVPRESEPDVERAPEHRPVSRQELPRAPTAVAADAALGSEDRLGPRAMATAIRPEGAVAAHGTTERASFSAEARPDTEDFMARELSSPRAEAGVSVVRTPGRPALITRDAPLPGPQANFPSPIEPLASPAPSSGSDAEAPDATEGQLGTLMVTQRVAVPDRPGPLPISERRARGDGLPLEPAVELPLPMAPIEGVALQEGIGAESVVEASAVSEMVPRPHPELLTERIPKREVTVEEFAQELRVGRVLSDTRGHVAGLLEGLRSHAAAAMASAVSLSEEGKNEIRQEAEAQVAQVVNTAHTAIEAITAQADAQREAVSARFAALQAGVQEQQEAYIAQIDANLAEQVGELHAEVSQRQQDLQSFAEDEASRPSQLAEQAVTRSALELDTAAHQATRQAEGIASGYRSDEDPEPDQREAASRVGNESAADILEKKAPLAEEIRARATEFEGGYDDLARSASTQLGQIPISVENALGSMAAQASNAVRQSALLCVHGLGLRMSSALAELNRAQVQAIDQVEGMSHRTAVQIQLSADAAVREVDAATEGTRAGIEGAVAEVEQVLSQEEDPFIPGAQDLAAAGHASVAERVSQFEAGLHQARMTARGGLTGTGNLFSDKSSAAVEAARTAAQEITQIAEHGALDSVAVWRGEVSEQVQSNAGSLSSAVTDALVDADAGLEEVRGKLTGVTAHFQEQLNTRVGEALAEAKRPLTDPLRDRASEAADEAGEAWYQGLWRALGDIVLGLLLVVAIAAVLVILTPLSFGAAVLVVGGAFLIAGGVANYQRRSQQMEEQGIREGVGTWFVVLLAVSDTTGITGVGEAMYGVDVVTGESLSGSERWYRGTVGLVTALSLYFGARAAVEGPPGGWTRPGSWGGMRPLVELLRVNSPETWFRSYSDFVVRNAREVLPGLWRSVKEAPGKILEALRWLKNRVIRGIDERMRPEQPSSERPTVTVIRELASRLKDAAVRRGDALGLARVEFIERARIPEGMKEAFFREAVAKLDDSKNAGRSVFDMMKEVVRQNPRRFGQSRLWPEIQGVYEDGTIAFREDVEPRMAEPRAGEWVEGGGRVRMDRGNGRPYRVRTYTTTPDGRRVVIDTDYTNHGRADHVAPHHHVYVEDPTNPRANPRPVSPLKGTSGLPPIDGAGRYVGSPAPGSGAAGEGGDPEP